MPANFHWHSFLMSIVRARALGIALLTAVVSFSGGTACVQAAQSIVVRRGSLTRTIDLADLKSLAKTKKAPPSLEAYARILLPQQRSQILSALEANFNIDAVSVRDFLDTPVGNSLISALTSVTSRRDRVGQLFTKTALIVGTRAPEGLSVISFIEAYPRTSLDIDLDQAFQVLGNFNAAFWQSQAFMAAIAPQLAPKRPQINLPLDPTQPGSAKVQVLNLKLNDQQRRREIPVDVYWSTEASAAKPIIVFSHGLGSVRTDMRYLAEHLASHGYVVAALEHPGSNEAHIVNAVTGKTSLQEAQQAFNSPVGISFLLDQIIRKALIDKTPILEAEEYLNRPKDISFLLDEFKKLNQTAGPLQGKLAFDRAMVVGYSLGGSTALSIAGAQMQLTQLKQRCPGNVLAFSLGENAQCFAKDLPENSYELRDPRVKAAIALSPTTSLLFGETGLTKVAIPTLITAASADKTTPVLTEQVIGFDKMPSPKWLVGFVGGTHLSVKDPTTTTDQAGQPDTLYTGGEVVGEQAVDVRNYLKAITLAMAAPLTEDSVAGASPRASASKYVIFLTSEYAQYASTERFPIRLVTKIPPAAEAVIKDFIQNQATQNLVPSTATDQKY
ncbi:MAG TPA: alpha/beta hydrolase [Coleofasciculaceae cyanobacterium]|jgi:predicted dienelactone hydrolase